MNPIVLRSVLFALGVAATVLQAVQAGMTWEAALGMALTSALAGSQALKRAGDLTPTQAKRLSSAPPPPAGP